MEKLFNNLKVIELASVLAGPAVGMFFAELGASVTKIENATTGGDVTRTWKITGEKETNTAAYFYAVNYQKEHIFLNLLNTEERQKLYDIIIDADIVISNYSEQVAHKLGVAYAQIKKLNPSIIFSQLDGYAQDSSRPAYDIVLQAETGFLSMTGSPKGKLARMPVALIDIIAAHQLKEGILIALWKKERCGEGSYVRTSLEECAIASLANQATNYLMVNNIPKPMGTQHPNIAPYGDIFTTKDKRKIVLAIGTDKQFKNLCTLIGKESMANNSLYENNASRVKNRATLNTLLSYAIKKMNAEKILSDAKMSNVPIGLVKNLAEVFETETGQKMILTEHHSENLTSKRVKTFPVKIE